MKKIREGNDFFVLWKIRENETPVDFSAVENIKLSYTVNQKTFEYELFEILDDGIIKIEIKAEHFQEVGYYRFTLTYQYVDDSMSDFDRKKAIDEVLFRIVPHTANADKTEDITIISDIVVGLTGDSAYKTWLKEGHSGSKQDFLDWIQEPSVTAGSIAEHQGNTAESKGNTAQNQGNTAEQQGNYAEQQGDYAKEKGDLVANVVDNENQRLQAEGERVSNEETRISQESSRVSAENIRKSSETTRGDNEDDRIGAENIRENNEDTRKSNENTRLSQESTRVYQENARLSQEIERNGAEQTRMSQESGRVTAESNRVSAENLRNSAESDRVELYNDMMQLKTDTTTAKNDATEQAGYAKDMGDYAKEQGDYAKQQGDLLNNRMPLFYGVEFAKGSLDPKSTRWIGDDAFKSNHVIFNDFKVAKVKDGKVIGVLNQTNWFEMEDGTPSGVVIDGTDVTDDGCDIMLVNEKGFYVLNGGTDPDFERRIVSDAPFHYGNDRAIYIEPYGMTVDFAIVKDGVSRCIRDNTHSGTATTGYGGVSYMADGLGVPTTYVSRFGAERYARAKNVDTSLNVPYANTFQLDKNVWATLLFIKFQTKDLHNQDCVGPCISANDSAPNIWGDKTGIRVKNVDETYSHYNTNSSRFMSAVGGTSWNFYQLINNYRPLLKIFDCQLALSHAKQNNIPQNTLFEFDGFQYSYENIQGSKGIADGEMTAKVRKFVTVQFTGYDNVDKVDVVNKDVEYYFEQGVVHGKIAGWGNIWEWVSGLEGVIDGSDNSRYHFYQTNDVRKLTTDSDSTNKENGEVFAFQNSYDYLGSDTNTNGYVRQMFDNSLMGMTLGGSLHTAECGYRYSSTSADAGKLVRRGVSFGGNANYAICALRYAAAHSAPTYTHTLIGFGFRVTLL